MNRLLSTAALLLSLGALIMTFFLWREVHALRQEESQNAIHARLSDRQLAFVHGYVFTVHMKFLAGTVARADVLTADLLLTKARYMHGDISREEWHRLILTYDPDLPRLLIARFNAGAGTPPDLSTYYEDLLESSR